MIVSSDVFRKVNRHIRRPLCSRPSKISGLESTEGRQVLAEIELPEQSASPPSLTSRAVRSASMQANRCAGSHPGPREPRHAVADSSRAGMGRGSAVRRM
eukprot:756043-Hanusia_phi.AAC.1